jgi:flagellar hook-basal body complex protein FliE
MLGPSKLSTAQGMDYTRIHQGQHGGASFANAAPVGYQGLLDPSLRASAHLGPLDAATAAASGMRDQAGGRRKSFMNMLKNSYRSTRKALSFKSKRKGKSFGKMLRNSYRSTKKSFKKLFKSKGKRKGKSFGKMLRNTYRSTKKALSLKRFKKMLRMRGGAGYQYANQADYASPGALLPPSMEAKALTGMNPEWGLSLKSFMPK